MKRFSQFGIFLGLLLLTCAPRSEASLMSFQANAIGVYQTGNSFWSGQAAWTPKISIAGLGVRGVLGAALLKNVFGDNFFAVNYELLGCLPLFPGLGVEAGGGFATWFTNGGTHFILSGNLVIETPGTIDRVFAGYSRFFLAGNPTDQFRLGIGLTL